MVVVLRQQDGGEEAFYLLSWCYAALCQQGSLQKEREGTELHTNMSIIVQKL